MTSYPHKHMKEHCPAVLALVLPIKSQVQLLATLLRLATPLTASLGRIQSFQLDPLLLPQWILKPTLKTFKGHVL